MKLVLFALASLGCYAQTVASSPAAPACLAAPVASGSVTVTCSLIDNTVPNGDGLGPTFAPGNYIFQVRVVSSDPDVIAVRIGVTFPSVLLDANGVPVPVTLWGSVGVSNAYNPVAPTPGFRYTFLISSPAVTGITVQELKVSSSQKF